MSNNLCQTFSSVAISAGIIMATFTALPLPNASSSFFPATISQEYTSSTNFYQQFFPESPRQQVFLENCEISPKKNRACIMQ